jgi:hypothetical protein
MRSIVYLLLITLLAYNCKSQSISRSFIFRDEGKSQLSYINLAQPEKNWYEIVPAGRDLQLVGNGRVLIGTGNGYEERDIATGKKLFEITNFAGTIAARRLRNGNAMLTGINWQGKKGIVIVEINTAATVIRTINYPEFNYARLLRETTKGTFIITANNKVFEGNAEGKVLWRANIKSVRDPHAWQAVRIKKGKTLVSTGYGSNFQLFSKKGVLLDTITGPATVNPDFFAGFQILSNGHYVVSNWQGHGPANGAKGIQVLEYNKKGKLVWSWKQDASNFSSIQGLIVLDGLDVNYLHVENAKGILAPIK